MNSEGVVKKIGERTRRVSYRLHRYRFVMSVGRLRSDTQGPTVGVQERAGVRRRQWRPLCGHRSRSVSQVQSVRRGRDRRATQQR